MGPGNSHGRTLTVLLLVSSSFGTVGVAAAEPPLADAGLDQTVAKGVTVYLDATGSRDPDGHLVSYEWDIDDPDENSVTPSCRDCSRTRFVAAEPGRYAATVTVTDDEGQTATDTLYVTVSPGTAPTVRLRGPARARVGEAVRYTAHATAGDANLSAFVWRIDGSVVERENVDGATAAETLTHSFGRTGSYTVSVTAVDADGQTASKSLMTAVRSRRVSTPTETAAASPIVDGPRLVTGSEPLRATYRLNAGEGRWVRDGETLGYGAHVAVDFEPGRHDLYAVADGSIATFADGTTDVVADPKPSVGFTALDGNGSLTASVEATDGFENLVSLSVSVDGERLGAREIPIVEYLRGGGGESRLELDVRKPGLEPGVHTVAARARDARGQTAVVRREVVVVGPPEIVRSGFVDDPVYAYDPRTDATRYTAHHVLVVDLNGMETEDVEVATEHASGDIIRIDDGAFRTRVDRGTNDHVRIHTFWAKDTPGEALIKFAAEFRDGTTTGWSRSSFSVVPSDPVIRLDVTFGGVTRTVTDFGMVVDASQSFDPDSRGRGDISEFDFIWTQGAKQDERNGAIAKFDSFDQANLEVRDNNNGVSSVSSNYLDYYVPSIDSTTEITRGPYQTHEIVQIHILTEKFRLTKNSYADQLDLNLEVSGEVGRITEWRQHRSDSVSNIHSQSSGVYYEGIIELPASEVSGTSVTISNAANPEYVRDTHQLPAVNITNLDEATVDSVTLSNLSYLVKQPMYKYERTRYPEIRDELEQTGYDIVRTRPGGTEYVLEERVEVRPAQYDNDTRHFQSPSHRRLFLEKNPSWKTGVRIAETREWTTTETEWRDSKDGSGEYTGRTRQVIDEPAEYRHLREYEHQTRERKTGYRTVTRYLTDRNKHTWTRTIERCNRWVGCYESTVTETYWTTKRIPYTTRERYTYWEYDVQTYWAEDRYSYNHRPTGRTKTVLVHDASHRTQYEYRYTRHHKEETYLYTTTRSRLLSPTQYEWRETRTTRSRIVARQTTFDPNLRIGERRPAEVWTLRKQIGTTRVWVDTDEVEPTAALRTVVTVNRSVEVPYGTPKEILGTTLDSLRSRKVFNEYVGAESIKARLANESVENITGTNR